MEIFKIKICQDRISALKYSISQLSLNIKVIDIIELPGPIPSEDPDTEITLKLLSEDLGEIFYLGQRTSKEPHVYPTF